MEFFCSSPDKPLKVCLENVKACNAVILIIGARAGSLIPNACELTYTGAEIREARKLGVPIFSFISTPGGNYRNDEPPGALREAHYQLRMEAQESTVTSFGNIDELRFKVLAAITHWTERGRPGARKTFASFDEFFAEYQLAPDRIRLFDFDQTLAGRDGQLSDLLAFLNSREGIATVLIGRGGIGKTKLLFELGKRIDTRSVMFVRRGAIWHRESDKELPREASYSSPMTPTGTSRPESPNAVRTGKTADGRFCGKLILGCRPIAALMCFILYYVPNARPIGSGRNKAAESLPRSAVRSIVIEELGSHADSQLIEWLVELSADTPLVTIAGARLIKRHNIRPGDITTSNEFQRIVFDRFIDDLDSNVNRRLPSRALIELAAALAPDSFNSKELIDEMAAFLKAPAYEVNQGLASLEEAGLLVHGWHGLRVVPDVLGDRILEKASVASGRSTGFANSIFERFGSSGKYAQILANFSEVDWKVFNIRDTCLGLS